MRVLRDTGYSEETTQEIYLRCMERVGVSPAKGSALAWLNQGPPARCRPSPLHKAGQPAECAMRAPTSIPRVTSSPTWRSPVMSGAG